MPSPWRVLWQAYRVDTGEIVSNPYFVAAPAYRVAERAARRLGVAVVVKRDGRPYKTFEPEARNV